MEIFKRSLTIVKIPSDGEKAVIDKGDCQFPLKRKKCLGSMFFEGIPEKQTHPFLGDKKYLEDFTDRTLT